jgi:TolA-binding protein
MVVLPQETLAQQQALQAQLSEKSALEEEVKRLRSLEHELQALKAKGQVRPPTGPPTQPTAMINRY